MASRVYVHLFTMSFLFLINEKPASENNGISGSCPNASGKRSKHSPDPIKNYILDLVE
jgi:hypothetical protein